VSYRKRRVVAGYLSIFAGSKRLTRCTGLTYLHFAAARSKPAGTLRILVMGDVARLCGVTPRQRRATHISAWASLRACARLAHAGPVWLEHVRRLL